MQNHNILCPLCYSSNTKYFASHNLMALHLYFCEKCGFYFVHPHKSEIPSVTDNTQDQNNFRFWGSVEAEKAYKLWRKNVNNLALERIYPKNFSTKRVLEIGFGEGPLTEHLCDNVSEYWGIEPVPASFQRTSRKFNLDPNKVFCLRAESLDTNPPFSELDSYFDAIILISVFEHLPSPMSILNTCSRLIKPGGLLFLSTPDSKRFKWLYSARQIMKMESWSSFHISFFNETNLENAFYAANFSINSKQKDLLINHLSADYFRKLTESWPLFFAMRFVSILGVDSLMHIQTLFYILEKNTNNLDEAAEINSSL